LPVLVTESAVLEQLARDRARVPLLVPNARRAGDRLEHVALEPRMHTDEDVLERGHVLEEPDVLKRAADAALGEDVRRPVREILVREDDSARRRLVDAGEHVEERRLSGAVRADEADDRPLWHDEVDIVDRDEAAELLAHRKRLKKRIGHQAAAS